MIGIEEVMQRISLPEGARKIVRHMELTQNEFDAWRMLFYEDMEEFLAHWNQLPDKYAWALGLYIRLAAEVHDRYREKGIEECIYDQTFYDITIWCKECYRKHGVYGLEELWWLGQSVKMKLFRLGRLQFEPVVIKEFLQGKDRTIAAGTHVLNVHIPAGVPLKYEECEESFAWSTRFFEGGYEAYICESWLMSPHLREMLPSDSNIIRFQEMFEVVKVHYDYPQAEQRIFGDVLEDKERYPEDTSLRRAAKQYLISGKDIGIGIGVIDVIYKNI